MSSNTNFTNDLEKLSLDSVYKTLNTSPDGLTSIDAKNRLEHYGRNKLEDKQVSNLRKFLRYFWGPIPFMIETAALLSAIIGHWSDFTIIAVLLIYNAVSGFWQERKAANALAALKAGMAPKAEVLRDGKFSSIYATEVVPGDVLRIKLGDIVPADVRFISGDYISIDQAALTGESLSVSKKVGDIGYSGSIAKKGEMAAVVIGTGNNTFFGRTAKLVAAAGSGATHSQRATFRTTSYSYNRNPDSSYILMCFRLVSDPNSLENHWTCLALHACLDDNSRSGQSDHL